MQSPPERVDEPRAASARSPEHWILLALAMASLVVFVAFALFVEPDARGFGTHEQLGLPPCRTIEWWGVPCPGCGVTTSFTLAAHGDFRGALRTQPFGAVLGVLVPLVALWSFAVHVRGRDLRRELSRALRPRVVIVLVALFLGAWIYKLASFRGWIG